MVPAISDYRGVPEFWAAVSSSPPVSGGLGFWLKES